MDILQLCSSYSQFRGIIRGTTYRAGWVRRWCFHPLTDIVANLAEDFDTRYWLALPLGHPYWELLKRGYTFAGNPDLFGGVDLSTRGRALAFLGFLTFILRNWPPDSVVPSEARIDLVCVPAWTKIQMWTQTLKLLEEMQIARAMPEEEEEGLTSPSDEEVASDSTDQPDPHSDEDPFPPETE
ncbi:E1A putative 20.8KDa protein [African pygmy hedgehog adenovirus 1]|nr:E1A putative 20.8KDa protein [African pygmy hedgehog adenovirus 1]